MHRRLSAIILVALAACAGANGGGSSPENVPRVTAASEQGWSEIDDAAGRGVENAHLEQLLRDHWRWRLENDPVGATKLGVHIFDDRLADISPAAMNAAVERRRELVGQLDALAEVELSPTDREHLDLLREQLGAAIGMRVCEFETWNLSTNNHPVAQANGLVDSHPVVTEADGEHLLARYRALPGVIDQRIENLRRGLQSGRVVNAETLRRVVEMTRKQLDEDLSQWRMLEPARKPPQGWPDEAKVQFADDLESIARDDVRPAFARFLEFLETELTPRARAQDETGLAALPAGDACYAALIRHHTTTGLSAQEIHAIGEREIERINAEMRDLGERLFGTRDLKKILTKLRTDPQLHFASEAEVEEFASAALAEARAAMPEWFGRLPQADCVVVPIPEYEAPFTTIAYYRPPRPDGSKPGEYYINTYAPTTRPRYEAKVLAVHEAIPGHHLQVSISQELTELPAFRRYGGRTVFVEGWALYTERLADEMGLYHDDLDRMGVLSFDAWRAGRLVVDTGIHSLGWSREQAKDYLERHTALAENNIDNEVDRYISWPGQALACKIGQLEILELRAEAERRLGDRFDVERFHDVLLEGGSVTLPVLRARVDGWIERELAVVETANGGG